jgi:hypothetical protein
VCVCVCVCGRVFACACVRVCMCSGETHFAVEVVSEAFAGLRPVKRQAYIRVCEYVCVCVNSFTIY